MDCRLLRGEGRPAQHRLPSGEGALSDQRLRAARGGPPLANGAREAAGPRVPGTLSR